MRRLALESPARWLVPPQREPSAAFRSWAAVGLRHPGRRVQPAVGGRGQGARRGRTRLLSRVRAAAKRRLISSLLREETRFCLSVRTWHDVCE